MKEEKKMDGGSRRRLRRAGGTLLFLAALTVFAVVGGRLAPDALPVSAGVNGMVYAISYRDADSAATRRQLIHDAEYAKSLGLDLILPDEAGGGGVILILEGSKNARETIGFLEENGLRAVFLAEDAGEADSAALLDAWERGVIVPAAPIGGVESPAELASAVSAAKLAFYQEHSFPCSVFVHSCSNIVCGCFKSSATPDCLSGVTVFLFGDGRNPAPRAGESFTVFRRIVRLPDWTIEEYFSPDWERPAP